MRLIKLFLILALFPLTLNAVTYLSDNFDGYADSPENHGWDLYTSPYTTVRDTDGVGGTRCVRMQYSSADGRYARIDPNPSSTTFGGGYFRFYVKVTGFTNQSPKICKFFGGTEPPDDYSNVTLQPDYDSGYIEQIQSGNGIETDGDNTCGYWLNGDGPYAGTCTGTNTLATSSFNLMDGEWHCIEFYNMLNTNSNTNGEYRLWIDGTERTHWTGIRNRNNSNPRDFYIWSFGDYINGSPSSTMYVYIDNVVVADTYIGLAGGDTTPPTVTSATINTAGTTLTLAMSESVTNNYTTTVPTLSMSGGAVTATCNSCSSGTSLTYTLSRTVYQGETGTYSWDVAANGVEDAAGNDLVDISGAAVTNSSTQVLTATRTLVNGAIRNGTFHP